MDANDTGTAILPYGYRPAAQYGYGPPSGLSQSHGYVPTPTSIPSGYGYGAQMAAPSAQSSYAYAPTGGALVPYQAVRPEMPGFPNSSPPAYQPPNLSDRAQSFHERLYHFIALKSPKGKIQDEESALAALNQDETTLSPNIKKLERLYRTLELLEARCIPPLEEDSFETVHLTIHKNEPRNDEKEPYEAVGDIRWVHVNSRSPDVKSRGISLDDFTHCAIKSPGLDSKDKALIVDLLEKVKSKNEKRFIYGNYLDPIVGQFNQVSHEDKETGEVETKTARFYCLPYFSLDEFPSVGPPSIPPQNGSRIHLVRTLLQTHYQLQSTENRDDRQVTRKSNVSPNVIHVPQVWCLLVNSVHIITCAPGDIRDVFKDTIKIEDPSSSSKGLSQPTIVRFTDWTGEVYFLPYEKCRTWFGLLETIGIECRPISNDMASEKRPNGWELKLENHQAINDQNWVAALAESSSLVMNINLQWKSSTLHQDPIYPGYGNPSHAPDYLPYQNSVMPYGMEGGPSPHPPPGFGGMPTESLTAAAPAYGGATNVWTNNYEPSSSSSSSSFVVIEQNSLPEKDFTSRSLSSESETEQEKLAELENQMRKDIAEATARARRSRANKAADAEFYQEVSMAELNGYGNIRLNAAERGRIEVEAKSSEQVDALHRKRADEERAIHKAKVERDLADKVAFWDAVENKRAGLEQAIQEAKMERDLAETALKAAEESKRSRDMWGAWEQKQETNSAERALETAQIATDRAAIIMEEAEILKLEAFSIRQEAKQIAEQNLEKMRKAAPIMLRASNERLYSFPFPACWHWHDMENLVREVFLHAPGVSELVNQGCYDLVVDDTIILPQCWSHLIEPGWTVEIQLWPARSISDTEWSDTSSLYHSDPFHVKTHRRDRQTWRYIRKGKVMRATRKHLWRCKCRRMSNQQWSAPFYSVFTTDTIGSEYQSSEDQSSEDQSSKAQSFEAQIEFPYTVEEASDDSSPERPIFARGPRIEEVTESDTENAITHGTETFLTATATISAEEPLNNEQIPEIRSIESVQDHHTEESTISWNMPGPSLQHRTVEDNFSSRSLATEAPNLTQLNLGSENATAGSRNWISETLPQDTKEVANDARRPNDEGESKDSDWPEEDRKPLRHMPSTDSQFDASDVNGKAELMTAEATAESTPLGEEGNVRNEEPMQEQGPTATSETMTKLPTPRLFSGEAMLDEPSQGLRLHLRKLTMDSRFHFDISTSGLLLELTIKAVQELALISTNNFWWERYKVYHRAIYLSEIDPIRSLFGQSGALPGMADAQSPKESLEKRSARGQGRKRPPLKPAQRIVEYTTRSRTSSNPEWAFTLPGKSSKSISRSKSDASSNVQTPSFLSDIAEDIYDVSDAGPLHKTTSRKGKKRSNSFGTTAATKPQPAHVEDEDEDHIIIISRENPSSSDSGRNLSRSTKSTRSSSSGSLSDSIKSSRATKPSRSTKSSGSTRSSSEAESSRSSKGKGVDYPGGYSRASSDSEQGTARNRRASGRPVSNGKKPARIQRRPRRPSVQAHSRNQVLPYGTDYSTVSNPFSPAPSYPFSSPSYGYFPPPHNYSFISPSYNSQTPYPQVANSGGHLPGTSITPKLTIEDKKSLYYMPSSDKPRSQEADSKATHALISPKGKVEITLDPTTVPTMQGTEAKASTSKLPSSMKQPPIPPKTAPIPSVPPIFMWPVWQEAETSGNNRTESPTKEATLNSTKSPKIAEEPLKGDYNLLVRVLEDAKSALYVYLENSQQQKLLFSECRPSTRQELEEKLKSTKSRTPGSMEDRKDLVEIAIRLLDAFVHKITRSELVDVFYGALLKILQPPKHHEHTGLRAMLRYSEQYLNIITEIRNGVSASSSQEKPQHAIPSALVSAFQHLVMVFCIFSQNTARDYGLLEAENVHHRRCEQLLLEGKTQLIRMHAGDLSKAKTCKGIDSNGLVALFLTRLVVIKEGAAPASNIMTTYQNYMSKIELEVRDSPSVRVFEDIQDLVEELQIIETIMRQQRAGLESSLALCTATSNFSDAFALQVFQKGLRHIDKQLNHVTELLRLAEDRTNLLSQAINVRKETNSVSILIFTAITVIFLPLSFITSYLTISDAQLIFWEAAIPLAVVILCLVWLLVKFRRRLRKGLNRATRSVARLRRKKPLFLNRS